MTIPNQTPPQPTQEEMRKFIITKISTMEDVTGLYKILSDGNRLNGLRPVLKMVGIQL